ncbi:UDP-2,3-diacylglucosamine hydrolase [Striga asiatica]|uniref:UDP-2,3-diacylglucosamine hydrolase n=1 Tax=Striga asiatica TaxID=4170 RepID=A0A5A7RAF8_STRAF|nr:UDP-2,3-diacylglucosamine hydrolase [Striga asiatica]
MASGSSSWTVLQRKKSADFTASKARNISLCSRVRSESESVNRWDSGDVIDVYPPAVDGDVTSGLCPEGDVYQVVFAGDLFGPDAETVGDQEIVGIWLVHVVRQLVHERFEVPVEIGGPVVIDWEPVAEGRVADVEARSPGPGEDVGVRCGGGGCGGGLRFRDLAVDEVEMGESDGEAIGS